MRVTVDIPDSHYRALVKVADKRETQVHHLLVQMVDRAMTPKAPEPEPHAKASKVPGTRVLTDVHMKLIVRWTKENITANEIADRLGVSRSVVDKARTWAMSPESRAAVAESRLWKRDNYTGSRAVPKREKETV